MTRLAILCCALAALSVAGCGDAARPTAAAGTPAQPGSYQEGGAFTPFYAEEVHEKRLYVFGTRSVWEKFMATKEMDPMNSRRMINAGPDRMTMILETTKDEPAKDKRILETVKSRYNLLIASK
jgi:hypothetical protein